MAFEVEYITLNSTQATNRYVDMTGTPSISGNVAMDIIGGTAQVYCSSITSSTCDFTVDGTRVSWNDSSSPLYSQLVEDDQIRLIYDRS